VILKINKTAKNLEIIFILRDAFRRFLSSATPDWLEHECSEWWRSEV